MIINKDKKKNQTIHWDQDIDLESDPDNIQDISLKESSNSSNFISGSDHLTLKKLQLKVLYKA